MDYKYVHEEIRLIYEHVNSGQVDPRWLATHCEILSHYANTLCGPDAQGTFFFSPAELCETTRQRHSEN